MSIMATNVPNQSGTQIEMQRVEKTQEATYLDSIQSQGYEHLGEPLQVEFNKSIEEIRNWVLVQAQNLNAGLILEVENPPAGPGQSPILVYYIWKSPVVQVPQAEPQAFACPYCTNPFMAIPGSQSQVVACPSCGGANIIPAMEMPTQAQQPPQPSQTVSGVPEVPEEPEALEVQQQTPPQGSVTVSSPIQGQEIDQEQAQPSQPSSQESTQEQAQAPIVSTTESAEPTEPLTSEPNTTPAENLTESTPPVQAPPTPPAPTAPPAQAAQAPPAVHAQAATTAPSAQPAQTTSTTESTGNEVGTTTNQTPTSEVQSDYSQTQQYSTEMPSFDYFTKKVESDTNKPKAPLLTPEYEQSYTQSFTSVEQAIKTNMDKLSELLADSKNTIKFYDSGELMYPKVTIRKSAYMHLGTREMDLLLIKDGVNDYKIIANETHGATGGTITPMQDELFAVKTLGHASYRAMEDWAYLDNEQKLAVSKCIFAFTDIYMKKLPKSEEPTK